MPQSNRDRELKEDSLIVDRYMTFRQETPQASSTSINEDQFNDFPLVVVGGSDFLSSSQLVRHESSKSKRPVTSQSAFSHPEIFNSCIDNTLDDGLGMEHIRHALETPIDRKNSYEEMQV